MIGQQHGADLGGPRADGAPLAAREAGAPLFSADVQRRGTCGCYIQTAYAILWPAHTRGGTGAPMGHGRGASADRAMRRSRSHSSVPVPACISAVASLLLLQGQGASAQEVGFTLRTAMHSTAMVKSQHIFHIERESHGTRTCSRRRGSARPRERE